MAGVSTDDVQRGGRRAVDSAINMIPMIDLLVCCISFLLITAVWSHMARLDASAVAPGRTEGPTAPPAPALHIDARDPSRFTLAWKSGAAVLASREVPRDSIVGDGATRFPALSRAILHELGNDGPHADADRAVVHAGNDMPANEVVGVFDAIGAARRGRSGASLRINLAED